MRILSQAFHTSYQYALATAFPEIDWYFVCGVWSDNRAKPHNVYDASDRDFLEYDLYLSHGPAEYSEIRHRLEAGGVPARRLIYISHWSHNPDAWVHQAQSKPLEQFILEVADSPIVAVSHFMVQDFGFFSHVSCEAIPHYVPAHLYENVEWPGNGEHYINIVNDFFAPLRGTGAAFWQTLDEIPKKLYGANNGNEYGSGQLKTVPDFFNAVKDARGYLWTGEKVAMSFAPLEAMACGCPVIAPNNMDWSKIFRPGMDFLAYDEGDKHSLLEAIHQYESDSNLRMALSTNGRNAIKKRFSLAQFRAKWQRTIHSALGDW